MKNKLTEFVGPRRAKHSLEMIVEMKQRGIIQNRQSFMRQTFYETLSEIHSDSMPKRLKESFISEVRALCSKFEALSS